MQLVGDLPLSSLDGLLSYAEEREVEEAARPLWIAHYALQKIAGAEPMPYDEFLISVLSEDESTEKKPAKRTPSDIEADLLRVVEESRRREGIKRG